MSKRKRSTGSSGVAAFVTAWRPVLLGVVGVAFVGLIAAVVLSSATGSGDSSSSRDSDSVEQAPPVHLTSIDGKQVSRPSGRPGMIMLSSSICYTCFLSAKFMADYVSDAPEPVEAAFVSVDPGDSPKALAGRQAAMGGTPYPFAIDRSGQLAAAYGITTLGTVVIYDAEGKIVSRVVEPSLDELRDGFDKAGVG